MIEITNPAIKNAKEIKIIVGTNLLAACRLLSQIIPSEKSRNYMVNRGIDTHQAHVAR